MSDRALSLILRGLVALHPHGTSLAWLRAAIAESNRLDQTPLSVSAIDLDKVLDTKVRHAGCREDEPTLREMIKCYYKDAAHGIVRDKADDLTTEYLWLLKKKLTK